MPRRPRLAVELDANAEIIRLLARDLGAVYDHVTTELALLDGFTGQTDAPRVTRTADLTPTEATAHRRFLLSADLACLEADLRAIIACTLSARQKMQELRGVRIEVPLCNGGRPQDGWKVWGALSCDEVVDAGGLCTKHRKARYRWRVKEGLSPKDVAA